MMNKPGGKNININDDDTSLLLEVNKTQVAPPKKKKEMSIEEIFNYNLE
jgi:hypothetical protein